MPSLNAFFGFALLFTAGAHCNILKPQTLSQTDILTLHTYTANLTVLCDLHSQQLLSTHHLTTHLSHISSTLPPSLNSLTEASNIKDVNALCTKTLPVLRPLLPPLKPHFTTHQSSLRAIISISTILWTTSIICVLAGFLSLFHKLIIALILSVPPIVWETLVYILSSFLILKGVNLGPSKTGEFTALSGTALGSAVIGYRVIHTSSSSPEGGRRDELRITLLSSFIFTLHTLTALLIPSQIHGTVAIWALLSTLGFAVSVYPSLTFVMGFFGDGAMYRSMAVALTLLSGFAFTFVGMGGKDWKLLWPFQTGVFFWCTFVYCLGALIASNRWYVMDKRGGSGGRWVGTYIGAQSLVMVSFAVLIFFGNAYEVESVRSVAGVFYVMWFLSKISEIPWGRIGVAGSMVLVGMSGWAVAWWVNSESGQRVLAASLEYVLGKK